MQATSDKTASANFTQTSGSVNARGIANNLSNGKTGYSPFYQWGRKDAFRSAQYTVAPAANTSLVFSATEVTVGTTIKNPTTFYNKGGDSGNGIYGNPYAPVCYNAWNATYTTFSTAIDKVDGLEKVVKTVYDPCPVGYTVAPANTFTACGGNATSVDGTSRYYASGGKILYFPWLGSRMLDAGTLAWTTTHGQYWLAVSGTVNFARRSCIHSGGFLTTYNDTYSSRSYGHSVRPVSENVRQSD